MTTTQRLTDRIAAVDTGEGRFSDKAAAAKAAGGPVNQRTGAAAPGPVDRVETQEASTADVAKAVAKGATNFGLGYILGSIFFGLFSSRG